LALSFWFQPLCLPSLFAQQKFSLKEAITYALGHNATYRNATLDQQISGEKLNEAGTRYLPRITGTVDSRLNIERQAIVIPNFAALARPGAEGSSADTVLQAGARYQTALQLDVTQPIVDMTIGADKEYAAANQRLADVQAAKARIDVVTAVTKAYYTVLLNQEKLRQTRANALRTENFYKDVKSKFENANALKTDVSRAYLNASNAAQQQRQAEDALRLSLVNVATQIGYPVEKASELALTDVLPASTNADAASGGVNASANANLNATIDNALQARVELKAEALQRESSAWLLQKSLQQNLPTVSAYGTAAVQALGESFPGNWFPLVYVGLRVNVPLSDWFVRTPAIQQQTLQVSKSENSLASLRQTIANEVQTTQTNLANATRNAQLQRENVSIAEELVQTATNRYKQGVGTNQEVIDAEFTLRETQTQYLQALYDALIARLEFDKAMGNL
jgi:outer membrane protein TolC